MKFHSNPITMSTPKVIATGSRPAHVATDPTAEEQAAAAAQAASLAEQERAAHGQTQEAAAANGTGANFEPAPHPGTTQPNPSAAPPAGVVDDVVPPPGDANPSAPAELTPDDAIGVLVKKGLLTPEAATEMRKSLTPDEEPAA